MLFYDIIPPKKNKKKKRNFFQILRPVFHFFLIALFVFQTIAGIFLFSPIPKIQKAQAAGENWLTGWSYRQPITIDNTGNANTLTNYQVSITLNTSSLVSAGKLQSGCQDLRFTDSNGSTISSPYYWIESGCNTASTLIWVKVPSIPASSTYTIYMYYGKADATAGADGANTFDFFDDFDGTGSGVDVTKWSGDTDQGSRSGGILTFNIGTTQKTITSIATFGTNYAARTRLYMQDATSNTKATYLGFHLDDNNRILMGDGYVSSLNMNKMILQFLGGVNSGSVYLNQSQFVFGSYAIWEVRRNASTNAGYYVNGTQCTNSPMNNNLYTGNTSVFLRAQSMTTYTDWYLARKYSSPEPSTSAGSEQVPLILSSVSDSPDPQVSSSDVSFASVADGNGSTIKLYICKDSSCTNCNPTTQSNCWAYSASGSATNPSAAYTCSSCSYSANNYYARACSDNVCSSITSLQTFTCKKANDCSSTCADGACEECYGGYCCDLVCGASGNCSFGISTDDASSVGLTTAALNGNLTDKGSESQMKVWFEWGETDAYGDSTAKQTVSSVGVFTADLTNLDGNQSYHFIAKASKTDDTGIISGSDKTFNTGTISVTTNEATNIEETDATLNATLNTLGGGSEVKVWFEWGTSESYGNETTKETKDSIGAFTADLSSLTAEQPYHFRAKASATNDTGVVSGIDYSFTPGGEDFIGDHKWAWAENAGWKNFQPTHGGVRTFDDGLVGFVWAENVGWIKLDYDGIPGATNTSETNWGVVNSGGNLSGYAWGENIGWVNFYPTHSQVIIDGSGNLSGYAWAENIGWIHFDHDQTDYTPRTSWGVTEPFISSVSDSPDPQASSSDISFASVASDPTPGNTIKLYICKASDCTNCNPTTQSNCWVVSASGSATNPSASYTCPSCATSTNDYYAKICNNNNVCSSVTSVQTFACEKADECACGSGSECYGEYCCVNVCKSAECSYADIGYLISSTFDTQITGGAGYNSIMWKGTQPEGTSVKFQLATSGDEDGPWIFYGQSGNNCYTNEYYSADQGVPVEIKCASIHNNKRYFRYKILLYSDEATHELTPTVTKVIVNYSP